MEGRPDAGVAARGRRADAEPGGAEPVFSFRAINYLVRQLTAHDASWDAYFLGLGYEPLKVTYEELAEAPTAVVAQRARVPRHRARRPTSIIGAPRLSVQADEVSEEWVARVLEHLAALEAPEVV